MVARRGATRHELGVREMNIGVGTLFSNLVMYFIILTTALILTGEKKSAVRCVMVTCRF